MVWTRRFLKHLGLQVMFVISYTHSLENLAFRRPTWQQYPWPYPEIDFGSDNAVDGMYTDRGGGGQCTINDNNQTTAMWRVDLGSIVSISHIDIYYRTDNFRRPSAYTSRMAGFFLYVSNTTSKTDGYLCSHEIQTVAGTPSEDQRINCSVHGRYVIYYNERRPDVDYPSYYSGFAYSELCEVEVYGCRIKAYFGQNCSRPCPINCQERRCDINTGHCLGCVPGYKGHRCEQVCDEMTYGLECALSCGNCSDGKTCHHVNGTCWSDCDTGVHGDRCQHECRFGHYGRNCMNTCSKSCIVTNKCNRMTGVCDGGCKPGWAGITCDQRNDRDCESCSAKVAIGVVVAVIIVLIGSIINVVILKRNHEQVTMKRNQKSNPAAKSKGVSDDSMKQYSEGEEHSKSDNYMYEELSRI
eukprot:XP_019930708.1 PREDICTED: uncharacterized protein LOC105347850 [Crassostrea gigas]